jgi:hypothetical protein
VKFESMNFHYSLSFAVQLANSHVSLCIGLIKNIKITQIVIRFCGGCSLRAVSLISV